MQPPKGSELGREVQWSECRRPLKSRLVGWNHSLQGPLGSLPAPEAILSRYVAELYLPAPVYMPVRERKTLGTPEYYGCRRGYWSIYSKRDPRDTLEPLGLRLIAELDAHNVEAAEDRSIGLVALRFAQIVAAYSGSPLSTPRLVRLGRVGESDGLLEQFDYYYLQGARSLPRVMLRPDGLEKLLSWFGGLVQPDLSRLELAARWYGTSLGAQDALDGYLSVWIGLESVGPILDKRVHKSGPKVRCGICANPSGIDRIRGDAGIEHAIQETTHELLEGRSLKDLKDIRHSIVHTLKPAASLRSEAEGLLPDLQLSLIFAILTAARPEDSAPGSGKAILPRDFRPYPDARHRILSEVELVNHKPFFGEWLQVERTFHNEQSRLEEDGGYIWGARIGARIQGEVPAGSPELLREYVIFQRLGRSWESRESDENQIQEVPWRTTPISPAWKRYLSG